MSYCFHFLRCLYLFFFGMIDIFLVCLFWYEQLKTVQVSKICVNNECIRNTLTWRRSKLFRIVGKHSSISSRNISVRCKSMEWPGTGAIKTQIPLSKLKLEKTKVRKNQNTLRTYRQRVGSSFSKSGHSATQTELK